MPILAVAVAPPAGAVLEVIPAQPGILATVTGAAALSGGPVVAWAQVADDQAPGGVRLDPVFLSAGRAWTPDQFRAVYGAETTLTVAAQ